MLSLCFSLPVSPILKVTRHSSIKWDLATVLVHLGHAGRPLICNSCGRPWHRQPHETRTDRNTDIKAMLLFWYFKAKIWENNNKKALLQGTILVAPVNVCLAWIWPGGSWGKMTLERRGPKNVKPLRLKIRVLDSLLQVPEPFIEVQFLPQGPGASPRHPYNQRRKRGITLVTTELILSIIPAVEPCVSAPRVKERKW